MTFIFGIIAFIQGTIGECDNSTRGDLAQYIVFFTRTPVFVKKLVAMSFFLSSIALISIPSELHRYPNTFKKNRSKLIISN